MIQLYEDQMELVQQLREAMENPRFERSRAKARGDKRYFNGRPCPKGHIAERMVVNGRCCSCMKEYKLRPENVKKELARLKRDREQNPEKYRAIWAKQRQKPKVRITASMYVRLRYVIKEKYFSKNLKKYTGYSREELMYHLERQFSKGMTWENYGKWHIDHIVPIKCFDYTSYEDDDFKRCWSLSNLRPLWAKENFKKSCIRTHLI